MRAPSVVFGAAIVVFSALPQHAMGQGDDLFSTLKVDVSVVVQKHRTGADMVTITVLAADYPRAELEARATEVGTLLRTPIRGLDVHAEGNGSQATGAAPFVKASFATNGIFDGDAGIRLEPIVRAFAGGVGTALVQGMEIHLEGAHASPTTLSAFSSTAVQVQGKPEPSPPAIVYRVLLKTQDPQQIVIPDRMDAPPPVTQAQPPPSGASATVIWVLVIVGALATGALVYNLALRGSSRTRRG
jgi:hypothetical protein